MKFLVVFHANQSIYAAIFSIDGPVTYIKLQVPDHTPPLILPDEEQPIIKIHEYDRKGLQWIECVVPLENGNWLWRWETLTGLILRSQLTDDSSLLGYSCFPLFGPTWTLHVNATGLATIQIARDNEQSELCQLVKAAGYRIYDGVIEDSQSALFTVRRHHLTRFIRVTPHPNQGYDLHKVTTLKSLTPVTLMDNGQRYLNQGDLCNLYTHQRLKSINTPWDIQQISTAGNTSIFWISHHCDRMGTYNFDNDLTWSIPLGVYWHFKVCGHHIINMMMSGLFTVINAETGETIKTVLPTAYGLTVTAMDAICYEE